MRKARNVISAALCLAVLGWSACSNQPGQRSSEPSPPIRERAETILAPARGESVSGKLRFADETNGVRIATEILGLRAGEYELRLTALDDCFASKSASRPLATNQSAAILPIRVARFSPDYSGQSRLDRLNTEITFEGAESITNFAASLYLLNGAGSSGRDQPSTLVACGPIKSLSGQLCCGQ